MQFFSNGTQSLQNFIPCFVLLTTYCAYFAMFLWSLGSQHHKSSHSTLAVSLGDVSRAQYCLWGQEHSREFNTFNICPLRIGGPRVLSFGVSHEAQRPGAALANLTLSWWERPVLCDPSPAAANEGAGTTQPTDEEGSSVQGRGGPPPWQVAKEREHGLCAFLCVGTLCSLKMACFHCLNLPRT